MEVVHILVSMSAAPVALLNLIGLIIISPIMFNLKFNRYRGARRDRHGSEVLVTKLALVRIDRIDKGQPDWSANRSVRFMLHRLHRYSEVFKTAGGHGNCRSCLLYTSDAADE